MILLKTQVLIDFEEGFSSVNKTDPGGVNDLRGHDWNVIEVVIY